MIKYLLTSLLLVSQLSSASAVTTTIEKILFWDGGDLIYVYPKGGLPEDAPKCHGGNGEYYSFSKDRSMSSIYISGLLAAHARKATVSIAGKGDCIDQSNSETLYYFSILN